MQRRVAVILYDEPHNSYVLGCRAGASLPPIGIINYGQRHLSGCTAEEDPHAGSRTAV